MLVRAGDVQHGVHDQVEDALRLGRRRLQLEADLEGLWKVQKEDVSPKVYDNASSERTKVYQRSTGRPNVSSTPQSVPKFSERFRKFYRPRRLR